MIFYNKFSADSARLAQRLEAFADEFSAIVSRQIDVRSLTGAWVPASRRREPAGASGADEPAHAPMSEINVTPFVDVMLVLLIIFMVAAPLMTGGVPLDLPQAKVEPARQSEQGAGGGLDRQGRQDLSRPAGQGHRSTIEELGAKLKAVMTARGGAGTDEPIFVRGDRTVDYGTVARVMARIKEAGFRKLSLVTETEGGASAGEFRAPRLDPAARALLGLALLSCGNAAAEAAEGAVAESRSWQT